jgi:hypothetical protein
MFIALVQRVGSLRVDCERMLPGVYCRSILAVSHMLRLASRVEVDVIGISY